MICRVLAADWVESHFLCIYLFVSNLVQVWHAVGNETWCSVLKTMKTPRTKSPCHNHQGVTKGSWGSCNVHQWPPHAGHHSWRASADTLQRHVFDEAADDSAMKKPLPPLFLQFWSFSSSRVAVMPHVTRNSRKDWKHPAASQMSPASTSLRYRNCSKQ